MTQREVLVENTSATVLVDNVSNSNVALVKDDGQTVILKPHRSAQVTWAEYVRFKNIPHFGRLIKLNDSVTISNGQIKIGNVDTKITEQEMIDVFVQDLPLIQEYVLTLNSGEKLVFKRFLETRIELEIDVDKCDAVLAFIKRTFKTKEDPTEKVEEKEELKQEEEKPATIRRGRRSKKEKAEDSEESKNKEAEADAS